MNVEIKELKELSETLAKRINVVSGIHKLHDPISPEDDEEFKTEIENLQESFLDVSNRIEKFERMLDVCNNINGITD